MPLRGKQPHERVCEANWRRSLCAAKRPARAFKAAGHLRESCGPHMCGPYRAAALWPCICPGCPREKFIPPIAAR